MPSYSKGDVILIRYPFSDRSSAKVRPAIIISAPHQSLDVFLVPLTSKTDTLLAGEFVLNDWKGAGLNIASAVKRGLYTLHQSLIMKSVGVISPSDAGRVDDSLRSWLGL
ncbi:MAG: type II toxin-antitoxin system PemK/MazF family toxin [Pyrinomonadaceae bacterium]